MASTAVRFPTPQRVDGSTQHTSVEVTDPLLCPPELDLVTRVSHPCICLCWGGIGASAPCLAAVPVVYNTFRLLLLYSPRLGTAERLVSVAPDVAMNSFAARGVELGLGRMRKPRLSKRPQTVVAALVFTWVCFMWLVSYYYHRDDSGGASPCHRMLLRHAMTRTVPPPQSCGSGWACGPTPAAAAILAPSTPRRPRAARARAAHRTAGAARQRSTARPRSGAR